jgi:hypothetical protein
MTTALFEITPRPAPVVETIVLAIDPGPELSAWVRFLAGAPGRVLQSGKQANAEILSMLTTGSPLATADALVIEQIAAMGMAVGAETFETVFWSGRFAQAWGRHFRWPREAPPGQNAPLREPACEGSEHPAGADRPVGR